MTRMVFDIKNNLRVMPWVYSVITVIGVFHSDDGKVYTGGLP
jgi:hypothetical protein